MSFFLRRGAAVILGSLALVACGGGSSTPSPDASTPGPDAMVPATGAAQVQAICARARASGCSVNAGCEADVMALYNAVPASCATQRAAFFACAATSQGTTCAMQEQGHFAGCASAEAALDQCFPQDGGTAPEDASMSGPTPSDLLGPEATVALSFEAAGGTPQSGNGTASVGIGPIGAPAGGHILTIASTDFPRAASVFACRVGVVYDSASQRWSFSDHATLGGPCTATVMGETTTFTVNRVAVSRAPAGNTVIELGVNAAGSIATGAGTIRVVWIPSP